MEGLETLKQWVDESENIVFFGGAGVSTESGIPATNSTKISCCSKEQNRMQHT